MNNAHGRHREIALILLFLLSHAWLAWGYLPGTSDTKLYALYAFIIKDAARMQRSPYDHFEKAKRESVQTKGMPTPRSDQVTMEYPPLALELLLAPLPFVKGDGSGILGIGKNDAQDWRYAFRVIYFLAHAVVVVGMTWWLWRRRASWGVGLFVGTVGGLALGYLLYDRLDLWLGLVLLPALGCLIAGRAYLAMVLLAVAVNLKLVPIALFPLFLLGALPRAALTEGLFKARTLVRAIKVGLTFIAACVAVFLPFRLAWGPRVWDFLDYHSKRGFQIESTWSSLLLIAGHLGYPLRMVHAHGADGLEGPGLPLLAKMSTPIAAAVLVFGYWMVLRALLSRKQENADETTDDRALALLHPQLFVWAAMAILALGIASAKVFSPQYLCWFLPCFLLVERPNRFGAALPLIVFLVAAGLTTAVFPWMWAEVVRPILLGPNSNVHLPTARVTVAMLARNASWVLFCWLALRQLRPASLQIAADHPATRRRRDGRRRGAR